MKINAKQVKIFCGILAASILFGLLYDGIATSKEKKEYPLDSRYAASASRWSEEYGVPEEILWAFCREESNFSSGLLSQDGRVGLFQISPEIFTFVCNKIFEENYDAGMLYDPDTNIRCGAAYVSYLFNRYGNQSTVYAAYKSGTDQVDAWLKDEAHVTSTGTLKRLPTSVSSYVSRMEKATELYRKLYP